ncbi:hypothetical protein MMC11_005527 [Xylographa trunciseda]|nr:hypothetical protein [Xylographa trunciseda]
MPSPTLSLLTLLLLLPCTLVLAISTGSVSIFADSSCKDPVFANNYTLAADICGYPGPVVSFDSAYNSYIVDGRPTCANGTQGTFAMYTDADCKTLYQTLSASSTFEGTGTSLDGVCLGLVEYKAVAFLCEGIPPGPASSSVNTLPTAATLLSATTKTPVAGVETSMVTMTPVAIPPTIVVITSTAAASLASLSVVISAGVSAGTPVVNATFGTRPALSASATGTAPLTAASNAAGCLRVGVEMGWVVLLGALLW